MLDCLSDDFGNLELVFGAESWRSDSSRLS